MILHSPKRRLTIHFSKLFKGSALAALLLLPFSWKPFAGWAILASWILTHEFGHFWGARMEGAQNAHLFIGILDGRTVMMMETKNLPGPRFILGGLCVSLIFSICLAGITLVIESPFLDMCLNMSLYGLLGNAIPVRNSDGALFMKYRVFPQWEPTKAGVTINLIGIMASAVLMLLSTSAYGRILGIIQIGAGCFGVYSTLFPVPRFSKLMSMSCFNNPKKL